MILDVYREVPAHRVCDKFWHGTGSPLTQYAPFYLWTEPAAAATFLWESGEFAGVVSKYGRPTVQTWIGGGYHRGLAFGDMVTHAVRTVSRIAPDADPAATATALAETAQERLGEPGLHSIAWAIDPRTWEALTFALHTLRPEPHGGELYGVPHVSAPHEAALG